MNDLTLNFRTVSSADIARLEALGAVMDVEMQEFQPHKLLVELPDDDLINPVETNWLQELAAAHELAPEATVETAA